MHQIIGLDSPADMGFSESASVNGIVCADFHIIVNLHNSDMGDFMIACSIRSKTEAVASDNGSGMDNDPAADSASLKNRNIRIYPNIASDNCTVGNHCVGIKDNPVSEGDMVSDDYALSHRNVFSADEITADTRCRGNAAFGFRCRIKYLYNLDKCNLGIFDR